MLIQFEFVRIHRWDTRWQLANIFIKNSVFSDPEKIKAWYGENKIYKLDFDRFVCRLKMCNAEFVTYRQIEPS